MHFLDPGALFITAHSHSAPQFLKESSCVLLWIRHISFFPEKVEGEIVTFRITQLSQRQKEHWNWSRSLPAGLHSLCNKFPKFSSGFSNVSRRDAQ